jgi:hypothetical protein
MRLYPIAFLAVLAACFGAQTLALRMVGGRTVKSESNYFSSIARLQTGNREKARVLMLGSSMTARLSDRTKPIPGIVNLGCDGGSAVITLRAIDRGDLKAAPLIIVEANMLAFELEHRGKEIAESIGSDWFKLGTKFPNLSATARPTRAPRQGDCGVDRLGLVQARHQVPESQRHRPAHRLRLFEAARPQQHHRQRLPADRHQAAPIRAGAGAGAGSRGLRAGE